MDIRQTILKRLSQLERDHSELKTRNEVLHSSLEHDEELKELEEKMLAAQRAYRMHKLAILNEPENRKVIDDLQEVKLSIKDAKDLLTSDLLGYFADKNSLEFKNDRGDIFRISFKGNVKQSDQPSLFDDGVEANEFQKAGEGSL